MKKSVYIVTIFIFALILASCSSKDDNPVQPVSKTYDVSYKLSGTVTEINKINYLAANGQLLHDSLASPVWTYQWTAKGVQGQQTSLEAVIIGQNGKLILEILADGQPLVKDSINGLSSGSVSISRSITLPYVE